MSSPFVDSCICLFSRGRPYELPFN
jgi:hypothetical protein